MSDSAAEVFPCGSLPEGELRALLARFGLHLTELPLGAPIPGSHWGEPEAGIIACEVLVRPDTPVHSALHEGCHLVCADGPRRESVHTDIGGDFAEENGVCFLQLLLAELLPEFGLERALTDMDRWGYSFRLGSAKAWFEQDAADARLWLIDHGILDAAGAITWNMRP